MIRPKQLMPRPAALLVILAGGVATLLISALVYLAPVLGFPFIDYPLLIGGIFTSDANRAFWLGYWIFYFGGALLIPALFWFAWTRLPGPGVGFIGALIKGLLFGLIIGLLSGLVLPLFGIANQLGAQTVARPGFFGLQLGLMAPVGLLLGHLAYGAALALTSAMGQGIGPLDTLGWSTYKHGETVRVSKLLRKDGRATKRA